MPTLAGWLLEHWRPWTPEHTLETRTAKLRSQMNRDELPIALVAFSGSQVMGIASLRVYDLEDREDLTPWLGGVYVAPDFRRQGVGAAVVGAVEEKARELGFEEIYLFTLDREDWYASLGWTMIEAVRWRGDPGVIMRKPLRSHHATLR
ncbi:MAG TPA: GNAT family N-acetyltransferase [Thermoanaerobaculia bacterium]